MKKIIAAIVPLMLLAACGGNQSETATPVVSDTIVSDNLIRNTLYRRAIESAVWGMPAVAFDAMRQAFLRDAEAKYNDVVYWSKQADWKFQVTTPNASSWYVYVAINTREGPVVYEIPPADGAGLFGSMNDAWQAPGADVGPNGADAGKGAKYLLLPPGFVGNVPKGYIPVYLKTYNGYSILRAIPATTSSEDVAKAIDLVKKIRMYPLSQASNPPQQRYIDMAGRLFDAVARFDITFYESLARVVNDEPVQQQDLAMTAMLKSIGIEKGNPFNPDAATKEILNKAIKEAQAGFMQINRSFTPFYEGGQWTIPAPGTAHPTKFLFYTDNFYALDDRAGFFFLGCAPPVKPGGASFYLFGQKDKTGTLLTGEKNYKLHVPANVPAKQFWAATVYDLEESNLIRESPKVEVNSYQNLQKNTDGSVDIYFGPKAPEGKEANWIYTDPGKGWTTLFRFYGPEPAIIDKTWKLPDIEEIR